MPVWIAQIFDDLEAVARRSELPRSGPCDEDILAFEDLLGDTDLDSAQVGLCCGFHVVFCVFGASVAAVRHDIRILAAGEVRDGAF